LLKPDTLAFTLLLAILTSLGPLSTDMYLPSLPNIGAALDADPSSVQLTLSLFLFGFAAGQIFYGPLSDRYGRKPLLAVGLVIYALASLACALAPTIEILILARFLQALGASGPIVLARSMVRDVYEGNRAGRELARIGSLMGLVPAVAPTIGGFLQAMFDWHASFVGTAIFGAAALAAVQFRLGETLTTRRTDPLSVGAILRSFNGLLGHAAYRAYVIIVCGTFGGLFAFISASSFVLQNVYGLSEVVYGICFGLVALSYASGAYFAQRVVGRYGIARLVGWGTMLNAIGGVAMALAVAFGPGHAAEIVVPMMVYMVGLGISMPQAIAGALMPFPDRAGAASSLMGFLQMISAGVLGVAVGHFIGESAWPLTATVLIMGLITYGTFLVTRTTRQSHGPLPTPHGD